MSEYYTLEDAARAIGTDNTDGVLALAIGNEAEKICEADIKGLSKEELWALVAPSSGCRLELTYQTEVPLTAVKIGGNGDAVELPPGFYEIGVFPDSEQLPNIYGLHFDCYGKAYVNLLIKHEVFKKVKVEKDAKGKIKPYIYVDSEGGEHFHYFDGWFLVSKEYVLTGNLIQVFKLKVLVLKERLQRYMEANGRALSFPKVNQQLNEGQKKRDKNNLLKKGIEDICAKSMNSTGKFPSAKNVIASIAAEADKDSELAKLVASASIDGGIELVDENKVVSFKTLQNWLSREIKPRLIKANEVSSTGKSRKNP